MAKNGASKTREIPSSWNTIFGKRKLKGDIPDKVKKYYDNGASDWIGPKPGDTTPILYTSSIAGSAQWSEREFTKRTGIRSRCFSYAYCGETSPMRHKKHVKYLSLALRQGMRVFLDSGAHSLHRMLRSGKTLAFRYKVPKELRHMFVEFVSDEFIRLYAEYVKWSYANGRRFDFLVTLDSQKNCEVIYEITKKLEKLIGFPPVPVYHGDRSLGWVKRYIDEGHKIIGVGIDSKRIQGKDSKHRYYSELHELTSKHGVATHGFAITGDRMLAYPFYSVDSATHIKCASFGKILVIIPEKQRIAQVHISPNFSEFTSYGNISALSPVAMKVIKAAVEANGFDYDDLTTNLDSRILYNARILHEAVKSNKRNSMKFTTWEALV